MTAEARRNRGKLAGASRLPIRRCLHLMHIFERELAHPWRHAYATSVFLLCVAHSLGGGLACNLAGVSVDDDWYSGRGGRAGNNCHQFAGRRGHAFHVVSHAGEHVCLPRLEREVGEALEERAR